SYYYFKLMHLYRKKLTALLNKIHPDIVITTLGRDMDFLTSLHDGSKKIGESHIAKQFTRNFHLMEQKGFPYNLVAHYWRKKQERSVSQLDAFVVLTEHDAKSWETVKEATIIPNSLPFYPIESSSCNNKKIISVGRLYEQKGYEMLVAAWSLIASNYPDWEISIYGNGEQKEMLEQQIKKNGIEKSFHLCEPVKDIINKYLESSFYVMSSRFEGFGMVLTEAMACGLPCISFNCPHGPSDIIKNEEDGFLVENGNIAQLAESISYLIEHEEVRKQMGIKAKENIKRYSPTVVMQHWENLFNSLKES
ncbi:MAG: glycosyltransferase family 4 protein, partial [Bacteroides sp.]